MPTSKFSQQWIKIYFLNVAIRITSFHDNDYAYSIVLNIDSVFHLKNFLICENSIYLLQNTQKKKKKKDYVFSKWKKKTGDTYQSDFQITIRTICVTFLFRPSTK
jgi:hypothetical protein